ncbi:MAG: hypothetical protein HUU15_01285, partial [Candidatus Brocadiae bacterium]|nr:hypothetical protein [Candidatus Brocadiia bacterium]
LRAETTDAAVPVAAAVRLAPTPGGWRIAETEGSPDLIRRTRARVLERLHDCLEYCHMRREEKPLTVRDVAAALVSGDRGDYVPEFPIQDASIDDYALLMPLAAGTPARTLVAWSIIPDIEGARTVLRWNGAVELVGAASFEQMIREALATIRPGLAPLIAEARRQLETASVQRRSMLERRIAILEGIERDAAATAGR